MVNERSIRKILTVFLASPGDLADERRVVREVVDKINRIVSQPLGWQIELRGWEDTLPGSGRPQELINKDVDSCDLFLGILWRRWGSSTGKYFSGFEEEFERARERYLGTQLPTIWLCFKKVEAAQIQDPGEQLSKVLAFRETQIRSKEFLFKEFEDIEDWRNKLDEWLWKQILDLSQVSPQKEQSESNVQTPLSLTNQFPVLLSKISEQSNDAAIEQLLSLINRISQSLNNSEETARLSWFEIARLCLFSKSLLLRKYADEFLSNHEIHLLYQYRNELETTSEEWLEFLRAIISDTSDLKVGWYWFKGADITDLLFYVAINDGNYNSRKQAIKILEAVEVCLTSVAEKRSEIRKSVLTDESATIRVSWLSYLGSVGRVEDLPIAKSASNDDDELVRSAAESARLLILARYQPNEALSELLEDKTAISDSIIAQLRKQAASLSENILFEALQHQNLEIRVLALEELVGKHLLPEVQLRDLINDGSASIKRICYESILKLGGNISLEEIRRSFGEGFISQSAMSPLIPIFFRSLQPERLLDEINSISINSISINGAIAYRVLATEHFPLISERIREDLESQFSNLEQQVIEGIKKEFKVIFDLSAQTQKFSDAGEEIKHSIHEQVAQLNRIIESFQNSFKKSTKYEFISAALSGLALHGNSEDIMWGRQYLAQVSKLYDPRIEAIKLVERYGNSSDVEALISIAKDSYGELSNLAAKAAVNLAPGVNGAASVLLNSEKPNLVKIAIESFVNLDKSEVFEVLEPLLEKENKYLHSYALLYFLKHSSQEELEDLLVRYLQKNKYYYHVVCLIDRVLYAPSPYREMYLSRFEAESRQYT